MSQVRKSKKRRHEELRHGVGAGTPLQDGGVIALPPYIFGSSASYAVTPGTRLEIQFGTDIVALTPSEAGPKAKREVLTVSGDGEVRLPESVQKALRIHTGDSVVVWNEGRRVFIEKKQEIPITLPQGAAILENRQPWGGRWPEGALFVVHIERAHPVDRPSGTTEWIATSEKGHTGRGATILAALDDLKGVLLAEGYGEFWHPTSASDFSHPWDYGRDHSVSLRPEFPQDVEDALERFRERWFATEADDRERIAIRPAVLELADLKMSPVDVAWILQLDSAIIEAYWANPLQTPVHSRKDDERERRLP